MLAIASSEGTSSSKCERKKFNEGVVCLIRESDLFFTCKNSETKRNSSHRKENSVIIYSHYVISKPSVYGLIFCATKEDILENVIFFWRICFVHSMKVSGIHYCFWTPLIFIVWKKKKSERFSKIYYFVFKRKYTTDQMFGIIKIFLCFWKKSSIIVKKTEFSSAIMPVFSVTWFL